MIHNDFKYYRSAELQRATCMHCGQIRNDIIIAQDLCIDCSERLEETITHIFNQINKTMAKKDNKRDYLKRFFPQTRETADGFRINATTLNKDDLRALTKMPGKPEILVGRSGTGIVVNIQSE